MPTRACTRPACKMGKWVKQAEYSAFGKELLVGVNTVVLVELEHETGLLGQALEKLGLAVVRQRQGLALS